MNRKKSEEAISGEYGDEGFQIRIQSQQSWQLVMCESLDGGGGLLFTFY